MIGVIADDLTGAAELGAVGLRNGLHAEVVMLGPDLSTRRASRRRRPGISTDAWKNVDLVCLDTDSRACRPAEAARRAAAAAQMLKGIGAKLIYKKTDSVLRGPVAAEIKAIMEVLCKTRAMLVPANPSRGRVIQHGKYYVNGKPIHLTEFGTDPLHPRKTCEVRRLVEPVGLLPLHVRRPGNALPEAGLIIGETVKITDLRIWASALTSETLPAGGADFFGAVLETAGHQSAVGFQTESSEADRTRQLFICGTCSDSARRFISSLRQAGQPVFSLLDVCKPGLRVCKKRLDAIVSEAVCALREHARVVLCTGEPLLQDQRAPKQLLNYLSRVALRVIRSVQIDRIYIEGGATAAAVLGRLGWQRLTVVREVAPGVVRLRPVAASACLVTIKPGSYTWPDEILSGTM